MPAPGIPFDDKVQEGRTSLKSAWCFPLSPGPDPRVRHLRREAMRHRAAGGRNSSGLWCWMGVLPYAAKFAGGVFGPRRWNPHTPKRWNSASPTCRSQKGWRSALTAGKYPGAAHRGGRYPQGRLALCDGFLPQLEERLGRMATPPLRRAGYPPTCGKLPSLTGCGRLSCPVRGGPLGEKIRKLVLAAMVCFLGGGDLPCPLLLHRL